ncbi:MAG: glucose dehydrogenase [Acidimicrobiia bacterium]|nr:glucose dehydrogenase [Acidimicrobiia bacterium]
MRIAALAVALAVAVAALLIVWDRGDEAWRDCAGELATGTAAVEQVSPPAEVAAEAVLELENTVGVAFHPADGAMFAITQDGTVVVDGATVIDLTGQVATGYEQGLLGITVTNDGSTLILDYTDTDGTTRVVSHGLTATGTGYTASAPSLLMTIEQPGHTHNGGHLAIGPDGYLYIGTGDGRGGAYTEEHPSNGHVARDPDSPLGKILRVELTDTGIETPPGNPWPDGAAPEAYVAGMRNPWRFSFDKDTGDLWVGDVGQNCFEEVTRLAAGDIAGASLGWDAFEGSHRFAGDPIDEHTLPTFEYPHDEGRCSVVGGYVYRGSAIPDLVGSYLFGDSCSGEVLALVPDGTGGWGVASLAPHIPTLVSFGEDVDGEVYAVSLSAGVFRLVPAP